MFSKLTALLSLLLLVLMSYNPTQITIFDVHARLAVAMIFASSLVTIVKRKYTEYLESK